MVTTTFLNYIKQFQTLLICCHLWLMKDVNGFLFP